MTQFQNLITAGPPAHHDTAIEAYDGRLKAGVHSMATSSEWLPAKLPWVNSGVGNAMGCPGHPIHRGSGGHQRQG